MIRRAIKIHYKVKRFCPDCNKSTSRTGKISLDSPKGKEGSAYPGCPTYRVDYPCKCGHDFELFPGIFALTDGEDLTGMFCDYPEPKVKVKKVKGKHSKGLFDHLLKAKKR